MNWKYGGRLNVSMSNCQSICTWISLSPNANSIVQLLVSENFTPRVQDLQITITTTACLRRIGQNVKCGCQNMCTSLILKTFAKITFVCTPSKIHATIRPHMQAHVNKCPVAIKYNSRHQDRRDHNTNTEAILPGASPVLAADPIE